MNCPYESNAFCARLPEATREMLCAHCHFRKYAKGQRMNYRYFQNQVALQLTGIIAFGEADPESGGRFRTTAISSGGVLLSPGPLVDIWSGPTSDRDLLCLLECTVAFFDIDYVTKLFSEDIPFIKTVYENLHANCAHEKHRFLCGVGSPKAYTAVRYVVDYCRRKHIPPLTHEQIALLCNRSRPTVTEMLHQLLQQEPELFQPLSD